MCDVMISRFLDFSDFLISQMALVDCLRQWSGCWVEWEVADRWNEEP